MSSNIVGIIYAILGLGILVFIHELGHFILAKLNGIKVEVFSLGYGKPIIGFKKGDTFYQIGYIPLGGFCKMAGEDLKEDVTGAPYEFYSKTPLQKLSVVFAGPFFNYVFGILVFSILFLFPQKQQTFPNKIDIIPELVINGQTNQSPAYTAGLKRGDEIVKINNNPVNNWEEIRQYILKDFDTEKILEIKRKDKYTNIKVKPILDRDTGMALIGISPFTEPKIKDIQQESTAEKYGLKKNDIIDTINGKKIETANHIYEILKSSKYKVATILVKRDNILLKKQIPITDKDKENLLGIIFMPQTIEIQKPGQNIFKATYSGIKKANSIVVQTIQGLKLLIKGKLNARKSMGGPVKILYYASKIAKDGGFVAFISFLGLLSVLLGFFNLLPIPPIDGSFILVFLYELITQRKVNQKLMEIIQTIGFVILITLSVLIVFNDVASLFGKYFIK